MKWKNNIVLLVAYVIGSVHESVQSSITHNSAIDCDLICSTTNGNKSTTAEENYCKCPKTQNVGSQKKVDDNNEDSFSNTMADVSDNKKTLTKRDTISEIIARRQKNRNQSPKSTFLPAENSFSKWQLNRNAKMPEKPQIKFKSSGLLNNNKPNARIKEIEDRLKELRSRMSMKPTFQSRNAFPDSDTTQNLIKQLKGKREELLNDLKTFQSKSLSGKYAFKERVGSVNPMQTHIEDITTRFKSKYGPKSGTEDEKQSKDEVKVEDDKEDTGSKYKASASTETAPSTVHIPVIVLRQSDASSPTAEIVEQKEIVDKIESPKSPKLDIASVVESTTKKVESVSLTLEKLKEKRQEAVMKIKDKLTAAKSNLKHLETNEES